MRKWTGYNKVSSAYRKARKARNKTAAKSRKRNKGD